MERVNVGKLIHIDKSKKLDPRVYQFKGYDQALKSVLFLSQNNPVTCVVQTKDDARCQTIDSVCVEKIKEHPIEFDQFGTILVHLFSFHFANSRDPVFEETNLFAVRREDDVKLFCIYGKKIDQRRKTAGFDRFELRMIEDEIITLSAPRTFALVEMGIMA